MDINLTGFNPLPIIIGVTGHRDIPPEYAAGLYERVKAQLLHIRKQYPHCPVVLLSSLAEGADRICARAALSAGCLLHAPLPMEQKEYENDFSGVSRQEFRELLTLSDEVYTVKPIEPAPDGAAARGFYYRQAGLHIAGRAHILIALWDGSETLSPGGGGTYETICFARRENAIAVHIPSPRLSNTEVRAPNPPVYIPEDERLAAIDGYNRDVMKHEAALGRSAAQSKSYAIDAGTEKSLDKEESGLLNTFLFADALSIKYRNFKLLSLRLLSAFGLLLVLSFLVYDEMESDLMLLVYGALIIAAFAVYIISSRRGFHEKYISYRALAEALRVQFYWTLCGINGRVWDYYTYTQKSELDYVRFFILATAPDFNGVDAGRNNNNRDCVYRFWIRGQYEYHSNSAAKKGKQNRRNSSAAKSMLVLSIVLFGVVLVMELFFKAKAQEALPVAGALRSYLLMHEGQAVIWRGVLKIALGIVSAATAFLANYYGSLALPQQIFDNARMRSLFESALNVDSLDDARFDETMRMIGRESLIESAGWLVMQRENAPGLFIG